MSQRVSTDRTPRAPAEGSGSALIRRGTREMSSVIKAEWKDKEKLIIGVVPQRGVQALEEECRKPRWKIWQNICPVHITTDDRLQQTIERLTSDPTPEDSRSPTRNRLIILASHDVSFISFNVPRLFRTLTILRVGRKSDTTRHGTYTHHLLAINGASTFDGVRLDRWQAEGPHVITEAEGLGQPAPRRRQQQQQQQQQQPPAAIYLGKGVRITTDFGGSSPFSALITNSLTDQQREMLKQAVAVMLETDMLGDSQWWRTWKGKIANILGVLPATAEYAEGVKGSSAAGLLVNWTVGPNGLLRQMAEGRGLAGAAGGSAALTTAVTTVMTAAGPAQLLAAGVSAAAYFVPWEAVITWLRGSFSWMWDFIGMLWSRFKDWCATAVRLSNASASANRQEPQQPQQPQQQQQQQQQQRRLAQQKQEKAKGKAPEPKRLGTSKRVVMA